MEPVAAVPRLPRAAPQTKLTPGQALDRAGRELVAYGEAPPMGYRGMTLSEVYEEREGKPLGGAKSPDARKRLMNYIVARKAAEDLMKSPPGYVLPDTTRARVGRYIYQWWLSVPSVRSMVTPPPEDTRKGAALGDKEFMMKKAIRCVRRYPEFFIFLCLMQWLFPGQISTLFQYFSEQMGEVVGGLSALISKTFVHATAQTIATSVGDALQTAEDYDVAIHTMASDKWGRPGALIYETGRTTLLGVIIGPMLYNRLP